ncbi:HPF/RaiA family ribosome-associated protein [Cytophaga aurantiaca]|uniref:HPF/RaiA family ribosome-associated protein n=1 Tax=Cytophaga aurantiaca TaxID=29530 RepID=UPI00035D32A0|nr:HPF/RaiA family ribosome-associated protein [Cytophaga aurantiaca]
MTIQFNTDKNIAGNDRTATYMNSMILDSLDRFSDHITRIEVYLSDENSNKTGGNDKRCLLEARLEGLKPIAVTNFSDTVEKAVSGAIDKLVGTLDKTLERQRAY